METHALPAYLAANPEDFARLGIVEHKPAAFEDGLRTSGGPGTYEWWYFDAHLDDGSKLVVVFYTKASGDQSDPLTPKISINLDLADGRSIEKILVTGADEFQARTDACDVRIAGNRFTGDLHTYHIQATIEDVSGVKAHRLSTMDERRLHIVHRPSSREPVLKRRFAVLGTPLAGDRHMHVPMYVIRIQGHLDLSWSAWFDGLTMTHDPNGETTLTGSVRDQAALHGILNRVFELNLLLIAVNRLEQLQPQHLVHPTRSQ
jgi:hypothetical protein